jgi:hypothetical protein
LPTFSQELTFEPSAVSDDGFNGLAGDFCVTEGREHRRAVVSENKDVADVGGRNTSLVGQHRLGAVLVQSHHRCESVRCETARFAGGDHGVGVGGISDNGHTGVLGRNFVNDSAPDW